MGYTTEFEGEIFIDPPLNDDEISLLKDLSETRRMDRTKGPLFVRGTGFAGQGRDEDILDYNDPHPDQPGLWCQWIPGRLGDYLEWNGAEKFYFAEEWMKYIIHNLLAPSARPYIDAHIDEDPRLASFTANHTLNGEIEAQGEDPDDRWKLIVVDNKVMVSRAVVSYSEPTEV